jgi:cellulose synthase/poly-beta-1,6-N-acetylglucosamine synthase-like glycosyltransferase
MISCSIGIIVHNEAENIGKLLDSLLKQDLKRVSLEEIIVVSSGSTDGTNEIVKKYEKSDKRIRLITESERNGKSAGINLFLESAGQQILIIESGDTIPASDTIEKLIAPFENEEIGMTGGRPVPENKPDSFIGYSVNLLWELHHEMALLSPKLGEMIAFRRIFDRIPPESAVDEASIEFLIRNAGLRLKYIPDAVIHNKGPEHLKDFIKQRRRIEAGHLWLRKKQNYRVTSQNHFLILRLTWRKLKKDQRNFIFLMGTILLEMYSRFLGWIDFRFRNVNPYKWDIAQTTKKLDKKI